MDIGKRLQELRIQNHISQEELAEILDVSRQTISRWESSLSSPHIDMIQKICHYYHITISGFFKEDQFKKKSYIHWISFFISIGLILLSLQLPKDKTNTATSMILMTPSMIILWLGIMGILISIYLIYINRRK